jgi:CDP-paratose 2-epimerase
VKPELSSLPSSALITGACGFIGTCLSRRLCTDGTAVFGIDNLSRKGTSLNARELSKLPGFELVETDAADFDALERVFKQRGPFDFIAHLSAQVAVTKSYIDPAQDFRDNAIASFNIVECARRHSPRAYLLYASTNKVYGHVHFASPVGLSAAFNPCTPYGVSKGAGELYFLEYGRREIGLRTVSFRQSCIYGHHQFGVEDQGWLAWFAIANLLGKPVTIYGDGKQTRDLLYVDDLVELYLEALARDLRGVYPVGGGPSTALNLTTALSLIEELTGTKFKNISHAAERPGDQPYFVADPSWTAAAGLAWKPSTNVRDGLGALISWARKHLDEIRSLLDS